MVAQLREFTVSNDALGDAEELRRRIGEDGYLFFRRLVEPRQVWELRSQVLKVIADRGWLNAGVPLAEGVAEPSRTCVEWEPEYVKVYNNVQRLEAFHRLSHSPAILTLIEGLVGEQVLPHPSKICRIIFPQNNTYSTPPHQDFVHIQGTTETYSCWMPLGDCPPELGGLAIQSRSHISGVYEYHLALGAGGLGVDLEHVNDDWLTADYEAGDALVFHSLTIHKSLPNLTPDRLRLSLDHRYQAAGQPIARHNLLPHGGQIDWEEVYAGWQSTDLQFYWKDLELRTVQSDRRLHEKVEAEAWELARKGNGFALSVLHHVVSGYADHEKREAARRALSEMSISLGPRG